MQVDEHGLFILPTDDLARSKNCVVNTELADRIIKFAEDYCVITSEDFGGAAGRKVVLTPWQKASIRTMYGWYLPTGKNRFRSVWCQLPKRQGKSLMMSVLCTWHVLTDKRADILLLASTEKQAGVVFNRIRDFIKQSPFLEERLWPRPHIKTIEHKTNGSKISILSSDNKQGKGGWSPTLICQDEQAEFSPHAARFIYDLLYHSMYDKPQSRMVTITSPQFDLGSLAFEKYKEGKKILDGDNQDISFLPIIYEAPENWRDDIEGAVWKSCPSADITVPAEELIDEVKKSLGNPLKETSTITYVLGLWTGSPDQWINLGSWEFCKSKQLESEFYGEPAVVGLDWASGTRADWTAYCITIKRENKFHFFPRFFLPKGIQKDHDQMPNITQRQEMSNQPIKNWARGNYNLHCTEGNIVDVNAVIRQLKIDRERFQIQEIRFDPKCLAGVQQTLAADGFQCCEVNQNSNAMGPAFTMFERLVMEKNMTHDDNPITNWMLGNCRPIIDKHDRLSVVKSAEMNPIDIIDCFAMSLGWWLEERQPESKGPPPGMSWCYVR